MQNYRKITGVMLAMLTGFASADDSVSYSRDVRPILSQFCFKCHGPDELTRQGGLRLDHSESAYGPSDSGAIAVVPGSVDKSELVRRIASHEADEVMPPPTSKLTLTDTQKDVLKKWISNGARYEMHWAFESPKKAEPPTVQDKLWNQNAIDRFAYSKLTELGLTPQHPGTPYEQIRRVYLDLVGLPPNAEAADQFAANPSEASYEKIVDDLLQSPDYGERWARKWLDLARYADTNGYEKDKVRTIWPYRDWVINALQNDMPFDQFTIEQLAGDMLPNTTLDQKIATGFHRNTMLNEEGGIDPLEFRFYAMTDRTATTGTVWLGLTMGCAQCHTHKYDPISHHEYYGMFALLNNADEPELAIPDKNAVAKKADVDRKIEELTSKLADRFPVPMETIWLVPEAMNPQSAQGTTIALEANNIVRAQAPAKTTDSFTTTLKVPAGSYDRLQLEALSDPSLPSKGPGLTDHGNFVLTELTASLGDSPIKLTEASADFAQSGFPANHAIDGVPNTGWATVALVQDLKRLGMLDSTLVIWGGEFGRTPMIESNASLGRANGRDHHPQAYTMWMAGGGTKAGFQYGKTDDLGFHVVENPVHTHDIQATIMHCLGFDHERLTYRHAGRDFRLTDVHGSVVEDLLSPSAIRRTSATPR